MWDIQTDQSEDYSFPHRTKGVTIIIPSHTSGLDHYQNLYTFRNSKIPLEGVETNQRSLLIFIITPSYPKFICQTHDLVVALPIWTVHEYMICCTFFGLYLAYFFATDLQNIFWLWPKMTVLMKWVNSILFFYFFIVFFFSMFDVAGERPQTTLT